MLVQPCESCSDYGNTDVCSKCDKFSLTSVTSRSAKIRTPTKFTKIDKKVAVKRHSTRGWNLTAKDIFDFSTGVFKPSSI